MKKYNIVTDVDGNDWIEIPCSCCGEIKAVKLPKFCTHECASKNNEGKKDCIYCHKPISWKHKYRRKSDGSPYHLSCSEPESEEDVNLRKFQLGLTENANNLELLSKFLLERS